MTGKDVAVSRREALQKAGGISAGVLGTGYLLGAARTADAAEGTDGTVDPVERTSTRCRTVGGSAWRFQLEFEQCDGYIDLSVSLFGVISDTWRLTENNLRKTQTFPIGLDLKPSLTEEITLEVVAARDLSEVDVEVTYCKYDFGSLSWNCSTLGTYHQTF